MNKPAYMSLPKNNCCIYINIYLNLVTVEYNFREIDLCP